MSEGCFELHDDAASRCIGVFCTFDQALDRIIDLLFASGRRAVRGLMLTFAAEDWAVCLASDDELFELALQRWREIADSARADGQKHRSTPAAVSEEGSGQQDLKNGLSAPRGADVITDENDDP